MCGIWAVFGCRDDISSQFLAAQKILHRGPDAFRIETIHGFPSCCLAFHRLSVIDDLSGMQPMRLFTHPHIWLMYNGGVYNYKMLAKEFDFHPSTKCDGEAIIHLYASGGIEFAAKHIDGVFAFCLLDTASRKVYLGRDTFGVKPLFRLFNDIGFLGVCSEAKGLIGLCSDTDSEIVQHFPPGNIEIFNLNVDGEATFEKRIQFHNIGDKPAYTTPVTIKDNSDMLTNIRLLFAKAVEKRLVAERRIGCFISGGLDSSLVASVLVRKAKELKIQYPIQTFAIGMEDSPDLIAARKVATFLQTEHHEVIFSPEDGISALKELIFHLESYDTITIRGAVAQFLLSKYIKEKTDTTVLLSGEGADEVAQGYIYFHNTPSSHEADKDSRRLCEDLNLFDVLRTDRTTSAWEDLRVSCNGIEKHLLRTAFDGLKLIPEEILWRPKEGFSDELSAKIMSWYEVLQDFISHQITDDEFKEGSFLYKHNTPKTKEELYYRRLFEQFYPGKGFWLPYYWMPKWMMADDPSARVLKHYKQ